MMICFAYCSRNEIPPPHWPNQLEDWHGDQVACSQTKGPFRRGLHFWIFLKRVFKLFHISIKKGPKGPDFQLPPEVLTMMNIFIEAKSQIIKLCALDSGDLVSDESLDEWFIEWIKVLVFVSHNSAHLIIWIFYIPKQHQYHTRIDDFLEKTFDEMIQLVVSRVSI